MPLLAVFIFEMAYRGMMLNISKDSVPGIQESLKDSDGIIEFFEIIVEMGSVKALCGLLMVAFMVMDKASSMYLWSCSFFMYYLANILESLYSQ